jgi:hypothetical protein
MTRKKRFFSRDYKLGLARISILFSIFSVSAQNKINPDYEFVNSVYSYLINKSMPYYYLYYKPLKQTYSVLLKDTLTKYISDNDILFMKYQMDNPDTSFKWNQNFLLNCKVSNDQMKREILSRNVHRCLPLMNSATGKPVKDSEDKNAYPLEDKRIYYFSRPVWNCDSTLVLIHTKMDEGFHQEFRTYFYKKGITGWIKLTELQGFDRMSI